MGGGAPVGSCTGMLVADLLSAVGCKVGSSGIGIILACPLILGSGDHGGQSQPLPVPEWFSWHFEVHCPAEGDHCH